MNINHDASFIWDAVGMTEKEWRENYLKNPETEIKAKKVASKLTEDDVEELDSTSKWSEEVEYLMEKGFSLEESLSYVTERMK